MCRLVDQFVNMVSEKNHFQKKYLKKWDITEVEKKDFECLLNFYINQYHYTLEFLAESYLFLNTMMLEEQRYFLKHGDYRNHSFKEVNERVYQNQGYMERYMCGLSISDYLWIHHVKLIRYFKNCLDQFTGQSYLEIGPGFGQYLIKAIKENRFERYLAVDISPESVEKSRAYLQYCGIECEDRCKIVEKDFFEFASEVSFDCIVMGEVLEHVENPLEMLKRIYLLLNSGGSAFITTVINSPAVDHIYLFPTVNAVLDMVKEVGFDMEDFMCISAGDISIEKAEKIKWPINIGMVLKKTKKNK